jgi:hypothetical protein
MAPTMLYAFTIPAFFLFDSRAEQMILDEEEKAATSPQDRVISKQLGVWQVLISENPSSAFFGIQWGSVLRLAYVGRLFAEIFKLGPGLFALIIAGMIWSGIKDALLLHFSSRLLTIVRTLMAGVFFSFLKGDVLPDRDWAEGGETRRDSNLRSRFRSYSLYYGSIDCGMGRVGVFFLTSAS